MNPAPPIALRAAAATGDASLLQALARRFNPRALAVGIVIVATLAIVGGVGLVMPAWSAALPNRMSRLVETAVAGAFVFIAVLIADELTERGSPRAATYAVAVIVAAVIGAVAGWYVRAATGLQYVGSGHGGGVPGPLLNLTHQIAHHVGIAIVSSLVGGLATFVHVSRRTALAARRRQQEAERARALARRRTLESELQALQARVEPMFLFDTLERIRTAYREDAAVGSAMMEDLILYLRAALPHLRESTSTVSQELRLVRAWLDIVGRGAAQRSVAVDAAASAHDMRLPALVLLPLAQCAVAGVGAAAMSLRMWVESKAGRLVVVLSTSSDVFSRGIAADPRLRQIDDRLRALYGEEAAFACRGASVGPGSEVRMELPLDRGEPDTKALA